MPAAAGPPRPHLQPGHLVAAALECRHVHALHGFTRYADEIVDDPAATLDPPGQAATLEGQAGIELLVPCHRRLQVADRHWAAARAERRVTVTTPGALPMEGCGSTKVLAGR